MSDVASDPHKANKKSRPDKRQSLLNRKYEVERAIPCGLASRIMDAHVREHLVPEIQRRVDQVSRAKHFAALILNDIVIRCCANEGPELPEIDQTFMRRLLLRDGSSCQIIREACDRYRCLAPPVRYEGDGQLYSSAACEMLTAYKNILTEAFEDRQKSTVKHWISLHPECAGETWGIIKRINGWGIQEDLSDAAHQYADHERQVLGITASLSKAWLGMACNQIRVLRAYIRWLNFREQTGGRAFSVVPTYDVRAHHITLDTDAFYGLFKASGLIKCNLETFRSLATEQIQSVFNTRGLLSNAWTFSNCITTNGVAASVHFKRRKSEDEVSKMVQAEQEAKEKRMAAQSKSQWRKANPEAAKRETAQKRAATRAAKKERRNTPVPQPEPDAEHPRLMHGTLAEDPGNSPNITFTVHQVGDKLVRKRLTIGHWYTASGVRQHQANAQRWMAGIQEAQSYVDAISIKTSSRGQLLQHAQRFAEVADTIWSEKLKRRWARGRFDIFIRKPKVIDKFYKGIAEDGPVSRHYFGGAQWCHLKGCTVAPNTMVRKRSKMAFANKQDIVDEHLTTQCCWKCHARTRPVKRLVGGKWSKVRGLVFCDSKTCGCLTNRDFQGGFNIGVCGQGPRPYLLTRQAPGKRRNDALPLPMSKCECEFRGRNKLPRVAREGT